MCLETHARWESRKACLPRIESALRVPNPHGGQNAVREVS